MRTYLNNKRLDIQLLRGIAVAAVILFHNSGSIFPNGYLGVDVFFVVSGFVVTPKIIEIFVNSQNQKNDMLTMKLRMSYFFLKRFMRLIPALSFTLIFFSFLMILIGPISEHARTLKQAISTILLVGNLGAWRYSGEYFSKGSNAFVHTWSLSVEEQIYIFLPIIIFIAFFTFSKEKILNENILIKPLILLIFFSIILSSLVYVLAPKIGLDDPLGILFYFPFTRLPEFLSGSLVFFLTKKSKLVKTHNFKGWIYLSVLVLSLVIQKNFTFPNIEIGICLLTALIIKEHLQLNVTNFSNKILIWLGDRSYSLYLVHMPISVLMNKSPLLSINRPYKLFFSLIFTVALGAFLYRFIESKFRIQQPKNFYTITRVLFKVIMFIFAPLIILIILLLGVQQNYFVAHVIEPKPVYAGSLGGCSRDNSFDPCAFPNNNPQSKILLIGDSQAGSISESFIRFAKDNKLDAYVWARTGCRYILKRSLENELLKNGNELQELDSIIGCNAHNERVFDWILRNPDTNIFLMNAPSKSRFLKEATMDTLTLLGNRSSKVLMIGSIPIYNDSDSYFSQGKSIWERKSYWAKNVNQSTLSTYPFSYNDFIRKRLTTENVYFMDPISVFCDRRECFRWNNGNWLYSDVSHLSLAGADLLFTQKNEFIKKFLSRE